MPPRKMKGISRQKTTGKWLATIRCQKKTVAIGSYTLVSEANGARLAAEQVKKDKGSSCRHWDIRDAVNEYRETIGMLPLNPNKI